MHNAINNRNNPFRLQFFSFLLYRKIMALAIQYHLWLVWNIAFIGLEGARIWNTIFQFTELYFFIVVFLQLGLFEILGIFLAYHWEWACF